MSLRFTIRHQQPEIDPAVSSVPSRMTHAELVQQALDLLSEQPNADAWLPLYDAALAADTDRELEIFCNLAERALELRAA